MADKYNRYQREDGHAFDPAVQRYSPLQKYTFMMPGGHFIKFLVALTILGTPGLLFLVNYRGGMPSPMQIFSFILLLVIIVGFVSRLFINKVVLDLQEIVIHKDHKDLRIHYFDLEDAYLVDSEEELDDIPLTDGSYPMEFETRGKNIVVLILKDGTVSRSSSELMDGINIKLVSFNLSRAKRFLSFLRMRI